MNYVTDMKNIFNSFKEQKPEPSDHLLHQIHKLAAQPQGREVQGASFLGYQLEEYLGGGKDIFLLSV